MHEADMFMSKPTAVLGVPYHWSADVRMVSCCCNGSTRQLQAAVVVGTLRLDGCRAAGALEEAAREYKQRTGRTFVLVIDAVDRLAEHCPDLLATFQV